MKPSAFLSAEGTKTVLRLTPKNVLVISLAAIYSGGDIEGQDGIKEQPLLNVQAVIIGTITTQKDLLLIS